MGQFKIKTSEIIETENNRCDLNSTNYKNVYFDTSNTNIEFSSDEVQDKFLDDILEALDNGEFEIDFEND